MSNNKVGQERPFQSYVGASRIQNNGVYVCENMPECKITSEVL
jgi:hypothetical protein